jgi:hypothetical protein
MPNESPEGWTDLARTVAGAGVQAEAEALRDAAPVRSFIARLLGVHTDERAWRVGAKGEQLVAEQLRRLGPSWHVLHSVQLSETGTDLDHLVIGPGGVFCLNAKHHPGAKVWVAGDNVYVNGHRPEHNYVRASRSEGRKVARLLRAACSFEVPVRPVVVVVGATDLEVKEQPTDVRICSRRRIADWLAAQPGTLAPEQVEAIFSVARRSTTWRPQPGVVGDPETGGTTTAKPVIATRPSCEEQSAPPPEPPSPVTATQTALVIKHSSGKGTTLHGDPRPHTKLLSTAGLRWSPNQRLWYVPDSRDLPPQTDLFERLAQELRRVGFKVSLEVTSQTTSVASWPVGHPSGELLGEHQDEGGPGPRATNVPP